MGMMNAIANWRAVRTAERELAGLDPEELRILAEDVGLSVDRLSQLTEHGVKGADELPLLMQALGIDPQTTSRMYPDVMRDMRIVCSSCQAASHCRRAIESGWAPVVQRYCPNAVTIKALLEEK
ncbi:hypothetical protein [Microvirga rosea]|uniref:hypothetical protein n=1 Tax=Microvirga rosea TaxID=2715425 RepID=UPI001D0B1216|nr:hypothetical protein [Microvirga rosea]MCB8820556.1 hypothetical protein [Microvirga rosea]